MFTGFLSFAGVEIINEARLSAYTSSLNIPGFQCDECPTLRTSLEQAVYTTPAADNAPWYDPGIPESAQVAGFQIASITGLGSTARRNVDQLTRDGAVVGARRRAGREVGITIRAIAQNECAISYAVGWLARVLRGRDCRTVTNVFKPTDTGTTCASEQLCMLTCCPSVPADIAKYQVTLYNVGVTEGPTVVAHASSVQSGTACGIAMCEVDVTFTAGDPGFYSPPVTVFNAAIRPYFISIATYNIQISYDFYGCGAATCSSQLPPGCPSTTVPLFNQLPAPCVGDPNITVDNFSNFYSIPLDFSTISTWMDLVPIMYYTASPGSQNSPLEGPVAFQLRRSTPETPCGTVANPCNVGMEMFVPILETGQQSVYDWVNQKAFKFNSTVDLCPFPVYTRQLAPFNWPTIICGSQMCLDIYINDNRDGREGILQFDVMRRQDAIC